jgi:SAM-dependent methyltransferase
MPYLSALDPRSELPLLELERRMLRYYANPLYHEQWIRHANAAWRPEAHGAQLAAVARIPIGARLLEVGCGDTAAAAELLQRVPDLRYHGVDISIPAHRTRTLRLARASGAALPFAAAAFDVVLSMFTIEHATSPHRFLDECWRVLRGGGSLLIIAPDFLNNAMASERVGFGYGTGREKLRRGQWLDALLTFFDSRVRLPLARQRRRQLLRKGAFDFPILTNPRCLRLSGFATDCDAVYPAAPEEISNYLHARFRGARADLFYRDASTFGIELTKTKPA